MVLTCHQLIPGQMTLTVTGTISSSSSSSENTGMHCHSDKGDHPWLDIAEDGIYCRYCKDAVARGISRSGRTTFISQPYTGTRPYHLSRHESSAEHEARTKLYREKILRIQTNQHVTDVIEGSRRLTVDGDAFCDALRCLYWLAKQEVPHTTNFSSLKELCVLLGNTTLPRLAVSKNMTYQSEQSMQEILQAISSCLEEEALRKVCASPYYSIVVDESTDLSVQKQLGVVVHYLDMDTALPECKYMKLLEITSVHATAEVVTSIITGYLETLLHLHQD